MQIVFACANSSKQFIEKISSGPNENGIKINLKGQVTFELLIASIMNLCLFAWPVHPVLTIMNQRQSSQSLKVSGSGLYKFITSDRTC